MLSVFTFLNSYIARARLLTRVRVVLIFICLAFHVISFFLNADAVTRVARHMGGVGGGGGGVVRRKKPTPPPTKTPPSLLFFLFSPPLGPPQAPPLGGVPPTHPPRTTHTPHGAYC